MILWATIIAASVSWLFANRQYVSPQPGAQWMMIGLAAVLGTLAFRKRQEDAAFRHRFAWLLLPVALAVFLAAPAYRPGLLMLGAGVALSLLTHVRVLAPTARLAALGGVFVGVLLAAQAPLYWLTAGWSARNPEAPFAAEGVYVLLKWLGADVSTGDGSVFVRLMRGVHVFSPTWDHLAAWPLLNIWVAGGMAVWLGACERRAWRRFIKFSAVLVGYSLLRFVLLILIFVTVMLLVPHDVDVVHVELFWLPWITAVSLVPLAPILARLVPLSSPIAASGGEDRVERQSRKRPLAVAMACLACLALTVAQCFWDPGRRVVGRVLLDESHSGWERTDRPYDTDWYGQESGYNYYCMSQYLGHFHSLDIHRQGPLMPDVLSPYSMLILKTPTAPYSREEIDAIEAFVCAGGGLVAVGEHTNVFGTSTCLNAVLRRFGLAFRDDAAFDIERKWEQMYFPNKHCRHPAVLHVPFFRFAVSCTIQCDSWRARPAMRSGGLWTLPANYASGNFYPQVKDATHARFGCFDQAVSTTAGKGRVFAFADSTVYSNFEAFYPGKPELLLGMVDWAGRTNRWDWVNSLALAVFVVAGVAFPILGCSVRPRLRFLATAAACSAVTVWAAMEVCSLLARQAYPPSPPAKPVCGIVFDLEHGQCELPVFGFTQDREASYAVFYQWILRLGCFPSIVFDLTNAMKSEQPVVLVGPRAAMSPDDSLALDRYLQDGGRLLVLILPEAAISIVDALTRPWGVRVAPEPCRGREVVEPHSGARVCTIRRATMVDGGMPLLQTELGETVAAYVPVGRGGVIVAALGDRFRDAQMGGSPHVIPDDDLRAAFELEFALLRGLASGNVIEDMRVLGLALGGRAQVHQR